MVPDAAVIASRLEQRCETLVATPADVWHMPSHPNEERTKRNELHRRVFGNSWRNPKTETTYPQQFSLRISARRMNSQSNSATSISVSEGDGFPHATLL